jgi:hypothetical protein
MIGGEPCSDPPPIWFDAADRKPNFVYPDESGQTTISLRRRLLGA